MKTRLITILAMASVLWCARADVAHEDELDVSWSLKRQVLSEQPIDLRTSFPVYKLKHEPALTGITYSACNWICDAAIDPARTAGITAQAGTLVNGVFTPDGSAALTVLPATTGEGAITWKPTEIVKKVYRLTHTACVDGTVDDAATYYGYLDFRNCITGLMTQAQVEMVTLGVDTLPVAVTQDEDHPWQPIKLGVRGIGIVTDPDLVAEVETETAFSFRGCGTLTYEFALDGGVLEIRSDGEKVDEIAGPTSGWLPGSIGFPDNSAHEVAFRYHAAVGATASVRNVRWTGVFRCAANASPDIRTDLREGVRTAVRTEEILPFVYSITNWLGDVSGSTVRVSVVQLTGTDPDVSTWTEVPGTARTLHQGPGESAVCWSPKKGVWKAMFEILDNNATVLETQDALFDLRAFKPNGLLLILR